MSEGQPVTVDQVLAALDHFEWDDVSQVLLKVQRLALTRVVTTDIWLKIFSIVWNTWQVKEATKVRYFLAFGCVCKAWYELEQHLIDDIYSKAPDYPILAEKQNKMSPFTSFEMTPPYFGLLTQFTSLTSLTARYVRSPMDIASLTNLTSIEFNTSTEESIVGLDALPKLKSLSYGHMCFLHVAVLSPDFNEGLGKLTNLENLKVLACSGYQNLTNLRHLKIKMNTLSPHTDRTSEIIRLTNLEKLRLERNYNVAFAALKSLTNLEDLAVDFRRVGVDADVEHLTRLHTLNIFNADLLSGEVFASLTNLTSLKLSNLGMKSKSDNLVPFVPEFFAHLHQLRKLRFTSCKLEGTHFLWVTPHLTSLKLFTCSGACSNEDLSKFTNLKLLEVLKAARITPEVQKVLPNVHFKYRW